ncbi:MAG: metallophosphoesterase [Candidatus Zixiibacteriota bacterium]
MKHKICQRCIVQFVFVIVFLIVFQVSGYGADSTYIETADTIVSTYNYNDGPHVFYQHDDSVIVFYYCNDDIVFEVLPLTDTVTFTGLCADSTDEYMIPTKSLIPAPDRIDGVKKFFAISDIHGDLEHLVEILQSSGIIDNERHWKWGDGHLVIDGDVFDRGAEVTECLWLIYRLEQEAAFSGGAVHFVLGNHELMVLRGDLRYVSEKYTDGIAKRSRFAYDELYGPQTELGRWLRMKNTAVRINRTLFVHGGLLPDHFQDGQDISAINESVRQGLDYSSLDLYFSKSVKALYGSFGPLWYRGLTVGIEGRYDTLTTLQVDSILNFCDVDEIVIGHSQQDSITIYHDGKVIAIDVVVEDIGGQRGLLWEKGTFYRVMNTGERIQLQNK